MAKQNQEKRDVKYIHELGVYWDAYVFAVINEIYVGIGINLGLSPKEAYKLANSDPKELKKGIFKKIFSKVFKRDVPKFRLKKKIWNDGKPLTDKQWSSIGQQISDYWKNLVNPVSEDVIVKANALGKTTDEFRTKKVPYKRKSLYQVAEDQYDGDMPETIAEAYKSYDFSKSERNALETAMANTAIYVTKTDNKIQEAIRYKVQSGLYKSSIEVASDLYWEVEKGLENQYTAEALRKDWHRIASTEMASAYEAAILVDYEADAMRSLKDPKKAQYFVFTGGSCKWCVAHQGTITRLIPIEIADTSNDSLQSIGIKDPNTDIALWIGKNNIGFKENNSPTWRVCTPAHPYNVATMQPINIHTEYYDAKTDSVKKRIEKKKYVPQQVKRVETIEEKEAKKPKKIDENMIVFNDNRYKGFPQEEINDKLEEWKKDRSLPIPVQIGSPQYKRLFEAAS